MMKAETKAKRRVTLSICGLALLDDSEVDSVRGASRVAIDPQTGEEMPQADPAPQPATDVEVVSDEVTEIWGRITNIKKTCEELAKLKAALVELRGETGQAEYYRILAVYGNVQHANQLKTPRDAKKVVLQLYKAIQQATAEQPEPGEVMPPTE